MSMRECEWEDRVERAARGGAWDVELRAHVELCAECADGALVAGTLRAEAVSGRVDASSSEPGRVWWRARLLARHEAAARATQPIAVWEGFASISGLAAVAAVGWQFWPTVAGSMPDVKQAWLLVEPTSLGVLVESVTLAAVTLLSFLLWFGLSFIRAED